jgi:hypothetical protein
MKIIHDDPPMPEEIENGFYPGFENGWRRAEVIGRCLMVIFIIGCVAGLLGPGLFSERHVQNHDASLAADYDAVVRAGAPTTIKLEPRVPPGGDQVAVMMRIRALLGSCFSRSSWCVAPYRRLELR